MSFPTVDDAVLPAAVRRTVAGTGVAVHPLALDGSIFGWAAGAEATRQVLDAFVAAGGNLVSTADHYAGGRSEIMIGSWLRGRPDRSAVLLATKVGRHPDAHGLSSRAILRATEASLARLGTDYIDFLSFDGEHAQTPLEESLDAAQRLVSEGKVRFLASAGHSAEHIDQVRLLAERSAAPAFQAVVVEYSLMEREEYEDGLQPLAERLGHGVFARLPLASGYLTGRFRTRDDLPTSIMFGAAMQYIGRRGNRVLDVLDAIALELGETPARIALAWVLIKPGIAAAIVRAKDVSQLGSLVGALSVGLTRQQVARLDKASAA